jgi:uncharacterized protein CbrC (UPF0167 family)
MQPCFEIVVYKVKSHEAAKSAREVARSIISRYPGFRDWQALTSTEDSAAFADLVTWDDVSHAKAAGEAFHKDARLQPFVAEIGQIMSMGHYA